MELIALVMKLNLYFVFVFDLIFFYFMQYIVLQLIDIKQTARIYRVHFNVNLMNFIFVNFSPK